MIYTNTPKVNNFDFTGHERLKSLNLGYIDAGARLYDPFVPRFTTIDPLAETSRRFSPFTYGNNNPIRFIDPDGMASEGFEYSNGYT
ncbi:MAG: RHS repeat-associated core domain-containing protein, partial [Arcicella sp.]|nr:RHS repeat-associated core domain-containing protein [Arcicella sp.]